MLWKITVISIFFAAASVQAQTYQLGGDCGAYETHIPDADIHAKPASGVNMHSASIPLDNIRIPIEIPLSDHANVAGVNANLANTNIRPGDINVNTNTGTISMNGRDIGAQPIPNPDCGKKANSIYSTK